MSLPVVTVTKAASNRLLVPLSTVKTELGISGSGEDTKLTRLLNAAGAAFAGPEGLGRPPWRQVYTEKLPGDGGVFLMLSRWPVEQVASIVNGAGTITATEYCVAGADRSRIYRSNGWQRTCVTKSAGSGAGDRELTYTVAYAAGWHMQGDVADWQASQAYSAGTFVTATDATVPVIFECTTAGTSDATEPTWEQDEGNTTTDGTVTWTARGGAMLPRDIQEAALITVIDWYQGGLSVPSGVAEEAFESMRIRYDTPGNYAGVGIPRHAQAILRAYR